MAWTLVSLAARAGRALGGRRAFVSAGSTARSAALAEAASDRPDVFARQCGRVLAGANFADVKALETALLEMGQDAPVIERAVASGAPIEAVAALAASWTGLDPEDRALIRYPARRRDRGPVIWGSTAATQVDQTTCGAASMAMMLMIGDPFVAAWVAVGHRASWYLPPEALTAVVEADAAGGGLHTVADRWDALQRVMHARVTRHGLGLLPWPRAFGSPPWRLDNATRFAGLRFRGALVDDARADEVAALAAHVRAAVADGIPVPLYASGDSGGGLESVVPRHVVLVVGLDGDLFLVYEPSSGALHRLDLGSLGGEPLAALGNWNRVGWAVLPRVRGS